MCQREFSNWDDFEFALEQYKIYVDFERIERERVDKRWSTEDWEEHLAHPLLDFFRGLSDADLALTNHPYNKLNVAWRLMGLRLIPPQMLTRHFLEIAGLHRGMMGDYFLMCVRGRYDLVPTDGLETYAAGNEKYGWCCGTHTVDNALKEIERREIVDMDLSQVPIDDGAEDLYK